jgi:hypothetical protein
MSDAQSAKQSKTTNKPSLQERFDGYAGAQGNLNTAKPPQNASGTVPAAGANNSSNNSTNTQK